MQMGIPLQCIEVSDAVWYAAAWSPRGPLTRLDQLIASALPDVDGVRFEGASAWGQTVLLATLVDYVVATYGREQLPALVAGLGQFSSWETLLASVYGVSVAEFEAGWQAYLAARYG